MSLNEITIAIDAMGGDYGLEVTIPASLNALKNNQKLKLILVGDELQIEEMLKRYKANHHPRLQIHHASQVVAMNELPSTALRTKKDSSMRQAINLVKTEVVQACVSAGNTGALLAISRFVLKTLPNIDRPAIIGILPNCYGKVHMLDLGANIDCNAEHLFQFAVMGYALITAVEQVKTPRVALLNIGEEEIKGNDAIKLASQLLNEQKFMHYIGYVEGNDIFMGRVDLVVCDGLLGNIALKAGEGTARLIKHVLKQTIQKSFYGKIVAFFALPILKRFAKKIDPARYNGACLLGLNGIVVKSHGGASSLGFQNAIEQAVLQVEKEVPKQVQQAMANYFGQQNL